MSENGERTVLDRLRDADGRSTRSTVLIDPGRHDTWHLDPRASGYGTASVVVQFAGPADQIDASGDDVAPLVREALSGGGVGVRVETEETLDDEVDRFTAEGTDRNGASFEVRVASGEDGTEFVVEMTDPDQVETVVDPLYEELRNDRPQAFEPGIWKKPVENRTTGGRSGDEPGARS